MKLTDPAQLPAADRYAFGFDLHLSGWGPFAFPGQPGRLERMRPEEYPSAPMAALCGVVYPLSAGDDWALVRFNLHVLDHKRVEFEKPGHPRLPKPEGFEEKLKADLGPLMYPGSMAGAFMAMAAFDDLAPQGIYGTLDWLLRRNKHPFVVVRTREACPRWFTEPGCGQVFHDDDGTPYRYAHPDDRPRKGDWALQGGLVRRQGYAYRGRSERPKVIPA